MFTVGSLFAGIGGIDLGFERQGFNTVWQVEINPYCQKVLAKNFPKAERYGDIRECGKHNLSSVDVIVGGFPCQDISNAGKRAGIDGERSGLWSEYARIIGELRPSFVLIENVAALLGRGIVRVLCDLTALGYDAEWTVLSAADVGAPHLRERVWVVAYPNSELCRCDDGGGDTKGCKLRNKSCRISEGLDSVLAHAYSQRLQITGNPRGIEEAAARFIEGTTVDRSDWWSVEPSVGRVAHGVPGRVDRLRGLGNAVVPQCVEPFAQGIYKALLVQKEEAID